MVEGKFFKHGSVLRGSSSRPGQDRQIGYQNRKILTQNTAVKKNQILFITFQHAYACNPKYICEELIKRDEPVEIYWALENVLDAGDLPVRSNIHTVNINSFEYFQAAASARVIVINSLCWGTSGIRFRLKRGSMYLKPGTVQRN